MPPFNFRLAVAGDAQDDAALRHLLRVNALPGEIRLSYEREPSYWAGTGLEGPTHQTMIVQDGAGRAVGMGSRAVRHLYVNGEAQAVGYLSQMRVDPTYAWGIALPRALTAGWRFMCELHGDGRTPYYLVSLVAGESVAFRMMTLGLPDWPKLRAVGGLLTYALSVRRVRALPHLGGGMQLRRAQSDDRAAIAACLMRNGHRRHFTPVWEADELGDPAHTPDLLLENFWVVEHGAQVVGTVARWDQSRFKQQRVAGYDERWLGVRRWVNWAARLGLAPHLPAVGERIRLAFASHLAVDNDDLQVGAALLTAVYNDAVGAGDAYLMVGLDSEHPLTKTVRRYRRLVYATQLFVATWGDEQPPTLNGRQMGADIAIL
jgi:hypothetical protein